VNFITTLNEETVQLIDVVHYYDGVLSQMMKGEVTNNFYYVLVAHDEKLTTHYLVIHFVNKDIADTFVKDGYKSLEYLRSLPLSLITMNVNGLDDLSYEENPLSFEDIPASWLPSE